MGHVFELHFLTTVSRFAFHFIQAFAPKSVNVAPDIEEYLGFVLTMFLAFGATFEVPIVVVVLTRMGVVSVAKLREFRRYFIIIAFIISAVITPPDMISMLSLAIPMCLLYEVGLWAAAMTVKKPAENAGTETS